MPKSRNRSLRKSRLKATLGRRPRHIRPELKKRAATQARKALVERRLLQSVKELRKGKSLSAAARSAGMSRERLRRLLVKHKLARKELGRRAPAKQGARRMLVLSTEGAVSAVLTYRTSRRNGAHLAAVKAALDDQDFSRLNAYEGKYIIDLAGKRHYFETRPNVLYQLDQAGAEPYEQVYQYIV